MSSTFSTAFLVSIWTMTRTLLLAVSKYWRPSWLKFAGANIAPVPRIPCGHLLEGYFIAATIAAASSYITVRNKHAKASQLYVGQGESHTLVSHMGIMIPCAPASKARFISHNSPAGTRTIGDDPAEVMAPIAKYISLSLILPCSQSIKTH